MQHACDRACVLLSCICTFGTSWWRRLIPGPPVESFCVPLHLLIVPFLFTFCSDRNVTVHRCRLIEITARSTCLPVRCRELNLVCPSLILLICHFPFLLVPSQLTATTLWWILCKYPQQSLLFAFSATFLLSMFSFEGKPVVAGELMTFVFLSVQFLLMRWVCVLARAVMRYWFLRRCGITWLQLGGPGSLTSSRSRGWVPA